jgi:hypothetical protein
LKSRDLEKDLIGPDKLPNLPHYPPEIKTQFKKFIIAEKTFASVKNAKTLKKYLLVNHVVYSSAESMAKYYKESGYAILVGSRTGGDGNGIGMGPVLCMLPNSGIYFRVTTNMALDADGSADDEVKRFLITSWTPTIIRTPR